MGRLVDPVEKKRDKQSVLHIDRISLDDYIIVLGGVKSKRFGWIRTNLAEGLEPEPKQTVVKRWLRKDKVVTVRDWDGYIDNCILKCIEMKRQDTKTHIYRIVQTNPTKVIWVNGMPMKYYDRPLHYKDCVENV